MAIGLYGPKVDSLITAGDLDGAVVELVRRMGSVTFAELQDFLEGHIPAHGDVQISLGAPNVVLWVGCSEEFCDLLDRLRAERRVHMHPCHPLVYLMDGAYLKLPLAQRPPKGGYKDPHWIPVCFRVEPLADKPRREAKKG